MINKCYTFQKPVFKDNRGYFIEQLNFVEDTVKFNTQQISESLSIPFTFRGFHFQVNNKMNKIMRVLSGVANVYVISLLEDTPTVECFKLSGYQSDDTTVTYLYVPSTYAVGFLTLEEVRMQYFQDNVRSEGNRSINVSSVAEQISLYKHIKHISEKDKHSMTWETWKLLKEKVV